MAGILSVLIASAAAPAAVPVVTILADFEDDAVAASLGNLENVLPTDCRVRRQPIPARGRSSLALEIGATAANVSVACDLRFREPRRFQRAERVATLYWLKKGDFQVAFRIRDARGQIFESKLQTIQTRNRWVRITADLDPGKLHRVRGDGQLEWPIQIHGYRAVTNRLGKQTLYLDDLQVEHRVARREMIRGEFTFDQPTRIYEPGSTVDAAIEIENRSREESLRLSVELAWTRPDGSVLRTQRDTITLAASGRDFRARQSVDFSQRIDQPGLYRLVARARARGWSAPFVLETSLAVTPSNRLLPRGRSTFFGLRSNLMREPPGDQRLEIAIARDIGVHLLAIETSWRMIEPTAGRFDFAALDPIVDALARRDMAPLLILTNPPEWVPAGPTRRAQLSTLLTRLAQHYGPKVLHYQPDADLLAYTNPTAWAPALLELQDCLDEIRPDIRIISPPLPADAVSFSALPELKESAADLLWSFCTCGESAAALETLRQFSRNAAFAWGDSHWWLHEVRPLAGRTYSIDAEAVLRHYVHAALAGVAGVIWCDLRDSDNDPAHPETMRGLLRRDFSPKASLLGYASAVGMLTGLTCRGPVLGTPPEFESALFVGSDRQVAVLLPRPNRIRPAVLAPIRGVPGEFSVHDFERRPRDVLDSTRQMLVAALPRPLFITLELENAQPEPQIAFVQPWLRVPATVFCDTNEPFSIQIVAPTDIHRGSIRLVLPPDAPFTATPTWRSFRAEAGQTSTFEIRLSNRPQETLERSRLTLKVTLNGQVTEVPLEVRPIVEIKRRATGSADLTDHEYRLGDLAAPADQRPSTRGTVFAAHTPTQLHLAVVLSDDRFVPTSIAPDGTVRGDELLIGIALEGADAHAEARVDTSTRPAALQPLPGFATERLAGWRCTVSAGRNQDERIYRITVPSRALGLARLEPPTRILLAVRHTDDDADGLPPVSLCWGCGLDAGRSAEAFRWTRLEEP